MLKNFKYSRIFILVFIMLFLSVLAFEDKEKLYIVTIICVFAQIIANAATSYMQEKEANSRHQEQLTSANDTLDKRIEAERENIQAIIDAERENINILIQSEIDKVRRTLGSHLAFNDIGSDILGATKNFINITNRLTEDTPYLSPTPEDAKKLALHCQLLLSSIKYIRELIKVAEKNPVIQGSVWNSDIIPPLDLFEKTIHSMENIATQDPFRLSASLARYNSEALQLGTDFSQIVIDHIYSSLENYGS